MDIRLNYKEFQNYLDELHFENMEQQMELQEIMEEESDKRQTELEEQLIDDLAEYVDSYVAYLMDCEGVTEEAKEQLNNNALSGFTIIKLSPELLENIDADKGENVSLQSAVEHLVHYGHDLLLGDYQDCVDNERVVLEVEDSGKDG